MRKMQIIGILTLWINQLNWIIARLIGLYGKFKNQRKNINTIKIGFMKRTARGRIATEKAYEYFKIISNIIHFQ